MELQKQITQKLLDHKSNEKCMEEWNVQLITLESKIMEKKDVLSQLEKDLKEVNLEVFKLTPASDIKQNNMQQHERLGSESGLYHI